MNPGERRSVSPSRSTHPREEGKRSWRVARVEGKNETAKRCSSLSVPIDTESEASTRPAAWIGRFSNIKRMHNGLQKRYQTRMAATERARGVSISIDAFGIGHSRYASRPSTRGYQAWLGPFVTSARRNWIMDDPPITRLSGSKRFESVLRTPIHWWSRREGRVLLPSRETSYFFSTLLCYDFFSFFASFSASFSFSAHPVLALVRKNGKLADSWPTTTFGPGLSVALCGSRYQGQTVSKRVIFENTRIRIG